MFVIEDQDIVGSWLPPEQIEFHCYNRIVSILSNHLYDVYQSTTSTAKEPWKTLEAEYETIDAGIERFTPSNFEQMFSMKLCIWSPWKTKVQQQANY